MKRISAILIILILMFSMFAMAEENTYVGLKKCKMCHKGEKKGEVYEKWLAGPHSKAYTSLASEKSHEVYASLGKTGDPQQDPECLKCHITGFGGDSLTVSKLDINNGVTCEACHGAGSGYWKKKTMQDREMAIAGGMIADPLAGCVTCHNEESPTYKPFEVEERWAEIKHERPEVSEEENSTSDK